MKTSYPTVNENVVIMPIKATIRVVDGKATMIKATWGAADADAVARFIMDGLGVQYDQKESTP